MLSGKNNPDPDSLLKPFINNEKNLQYKAYTDIPIRELLDRAGSPQNRFNSIHIAGTNGKGSTAAYLESIFITAGYKTGLYTSPHLSSITERIKVNGVQISRGRLADIIEKLKSFLPRPDKSDPTWFDIITASSFIYFSDEKVDIAIIETGLGGKKDSTNVITPLLSILTDISPDHQSILGDSMEEITAEKCGIIKARVPVVTSNTDPIILNIIHKTAERMESPVYIYGSDFRGDSREFINKKQKFSYVFPEKKLTINDIFLFHPSESQISNASLAVTGAVILSERYNRLTIPLIQKSIDLTRIYGRFITTDTVPELIFDPAHNIASVTDLCVTMDRLYENTERCCIVSFMMDKDIKPMMKSLAAGFNKIYYYPLDDSRAYHPEPELSAEFGMKIISFSDISDIIAEYNNPGRSILFTGTFRLYETFLRVKQIYEMEKIIPYTGQEI